mmetsp:Transcript_22418/g.48397  ORF Transcript_22418/g.48397 Transcript_22418/m.48397 type:complete len:285 (-) Transcript_22418:436-1290(-)
MLKVSPTKWKNGEIHTEGLPRRHTERVDTALSPHMSLSHLGLGCFELLQIFAPLQQLGHLLHAHVAVSLLEDVAFVRRAEELEARCSRKAKHLEQRLDLGIGQHQTVGTVSKVHTHAPQHVEGSGTHSGLLSVDQQSHGGVGYLVNEARYGLDLQRRPHDNEQITLRKVFLHKRLKGGRKSLSKEGDVGLHQSRAAVPLTAGDLIGKHGILDIIDGVLVAALDAVTGTEPTVALKHLVVGQARQILQAVDVLRVGAQQNTFVVQQLDEVMGRRGLELARKELFG